jgi:hypothetical protein
MARDGDRGPAGTGEPHSQLEPEPGRRVALRVQPGSGDRGVACDRRVETDHAGSDAPLTAQCLYQCPGS